MLVNIWWSDLRGVEPGARPRCDSDCGVRGLRRHVRPRDLDQGGEGCGVVDGELGQHASVDLDLGRLQTLDEAVVGHAIGAGAGVDPLDPEATEVTLAGATVAVGITERVCLLYT